MRHEYALMVSNMCYEDAIKAKNEIERKCKSLGIVQDVNIQILTRGIKEVYGEWKEVQQIETTTKGI